jgi:hypothetical protein
VCHLVRTTITAILLVAAIGIRQPASAWQSGPWDGSGFDQPIGMSALASARIAGAIAQGQAYSAGRRVGTGTKPVDNVIVGPSGCQVNVGGISLPTGGSINNSNITLNTNNSNATTIVVCK